MLVLTRKVGEGILAPSCGLTVTVLAVEGATVRLGVEAPAEVAVFREEVWCRIRAETEGEPISP